MAFVLTVTAAGVARAGEVQLISAADPSLIQPGVFGNGNGSVVSQDGRYVLFSSSAPNLIPGQNDFNDTSDVFLHDRVAGTQLVSHSFDSATTTADRLSTPSSISADGRWVVFSSGISTLVAGYPADSRTNVYLFDRITGTVILVSKTAGGGGNGSSTGAVVSADGGFIAFTSRATDLVTGQTDTNFGADVFLYDRAADALTLVSHAASSPTTAGNGQCGELTLSADGRYVAFTSAATDLVTGQTDTNNQSDVFLYDRDTGAVALASRSSASATTAGAATAGSSGPRISADGRYIGFSSDATDLVAGQADAAGTLDVFLFDRVAGATTLVSQSAGDPLAGAGGSELALSADGSHVAFTSEGTGLVPGQVDTAGTSDLFLFERASGTVTLASHAAGSPLTAAGQGVISPGISADGAWVSFQSAGTDLVAGQTDANDAVDTFLYDRAANTVRLASRTAGSATTTASGETRPTALSADGSTLVFTSWGDDLVTPDTNDASDAFFYDRTTQTVTALSIAAPLNSLTGNGRSQPWSISADGRWVGFFSFAANLVPGQVDTNGASDVFLYDRVTGIRTLLSHTGGLSLTAAGGVGPVLSADGRFAVFSSASGDIILHDRVTANQTLVTRRYDAPTVGAGQSTLGDLSADGRYVAWVSSATTLVPLESDPNGFTGTDIYVFDRVNAALSMVSYKSGSPSQTGNDRSFAPRISADGRYVLFVSQATDLVAGQVDNNTGVGAFFLGADAFLHDRVTGVTVLASRSAASASATGNEALGFTLPVLSADGRFVLFTSRATDLVPGQVDTNGLFDIFLFDRETGATTLISHASGSAVTTGNNGSGIGSGSIGLSADGRWIVYSSASTDILAGITDVNGTGGDVFLYDRLSGTTSLVSRSSLSPDSTGNRSVGISLQISADGTRIAFNSFATDMIPGQDDGNLDADAFLYDRVAGTMTLMNPRPGSEIQTANRGVLGLLSSADGSTVAFTSRASDLAPGDFNGADDAFLFTATPPGSFFTLPACRLLDTRQPQDGPALASETTTILSLHGSCSIPATARAVAVNVTITQPTDSGHLTLYTGDASPPLASTINFSAGQTRANNAILALATNGTGTLAARPVVLGGGSVHVILDVVGYFE